MITAIHRAQGCRDTGSVTGGDDPQPEDPIFQEPAVPRAYTVSDAVRERSRKGAEAVNSPDGLIARIERAKKNLTPENIERLRALLADAPTAAKNDES